MVANGAEVSNAHPSSVHWLRTSSPQGREGESMALHSLFTTAAENLTAAGADKAHSIPFAGDDGEQYGRPATADPGARAPYAHTADLSGWSCARAELMLLHGIPKVFSQGVAAFAAAGPARRGIKPAPRSPMWWRSSRRSGRLHRAGLFTVSRLRSRSDGGDHSRPCRNRLDESRHGIPSGA
jgi:hypothetical protein